MSATVTDPAVFGLTAALRRIATAYRLPPERLLRACKTLRAELDRSTDPDYRAIVEIAIREMMRD